ncbi:hypothetical protein KP79_PYT16241 [Mizuhopecten yessoensis]|uniref:Uncharacterized protein n=1 Tax=Mizuhopecten yessoensis TaxID=6573 RepID=A0A210R6G5_MIZYE|nr:hypothetical protein KP79_PYT16241 [Mizuhopecten yessoensis]
MGEPVGVDLGLITLGVDIWWQERGGMKWGAIEKKVEMMKGYEDPPSLMVIHCGGNTIDYTPLHELCPEIVSGLKRIVAAFHKQLLYGLKSCPGCLGGLALMRRQWRGLGLD